jgi:hypothetical protein
MAYAGTPIVRNQRLRLPNVPKPIRLDTAAWRTWLATATAFAYVPANVLDAFTVRKEKRRHTWYWYAYLKIDAKLHNAYVGRTEAVTAARLAQVTQTLRNKVQQRRKARWEGGITP